MLDVEKAISEIDGMISFYSIGMENAKRAKNYEKYYQFEEAYKSIVWDEVKNRTFGHF